MGDDVEGEIRSVIDRWVAAFRDRSPSAAVEIHADDLVSFDIVPPLRFRGSGEYRAAWEAAFALYDGPITMHVQDLVITARDGIAFSHSLNRFTGTTTTGRPVDYWLRWTACFERRDGRWLIVHDHTSLPTDFATGTAVMTLQP